jgi:hypothetical protein
MPTFTKKYLKDKDGNYLAPASLAELIQHNDGETTEVKMQVVEDKLGTGVLDTVAQDMTGAINELKPIADEVITARTDANGTYNSLDERLDAMDIKIAAAGGGGTIDLSNYQTKEDTTLETTSKQVVGAINEVHSEMLTVEDFVGNGTTTNDVVAKVATLEVNTNALMQEIEVARTATDGTVHNTLGQRLDSIADDFLPLTGGQMTGNIKLSNNNTFLTGLLTDGTEVTVVQVADNNAVYLGDTSVPSYIKGTQTSILQQTSIHGRLQVVDDEMRVRLTTTGTGWVLGGATDDGVRYDYFAPLVDDTPKWNNSIRYYDKLYQGANMNIFTPEVFSFGASLCPNNGETAVRNLGSEEVSYAKWTNIFLTDCVVANNGVIKLPNKTLMQWGTIDLTITTGTATKQLVTLPTQFPNGCLYAQANVDYNISSSPNAGGRYWDVAYLTANVSIESAATIMVHLADPGNKIPGGDRTYRVTWMAFGY